MCLGMIRDLIADAEFEHKLAAVGEFGFQFTHRTLITGYRLLNTAFHRHKHILPPRIGDNFRLKAHFTQKL